MKKLIIITLMALVPVLTHSGKNKIDFIREKLVITPKEQGVNNSNIAKKITLGLGLPILFDFSLKNAKYPINWLLKIAPLSTKLQVLIADNRESVEDYLNSIKPTNLSFCRPILIYYIVHRIILNKLEKEAFIRFLKEWELNKPFTPKKLRYSFDELSKLIKQHQALNPKANSKKFNDLKLLIAKKTKDLKLRIKKMITESSSNKTSNSQERISYDDKLAWDFFDEKFTKPSRLKSRAIALGLLNSLGQGALFYTYLSFYFDTGNIPINKGIKFIGKSLYNNLGLNFRTLSTTLFTIGSFRAIYKSNVSIEEQKALKNYIENWDANGENTPKKLQQFLESISLRYKENPQQIDLAEATRIVRKITNNERTKIAIQYQE